MKRAIKILGALLILSSVVFAAQQLNQLTIGNFTVNVPAGNPAVTVQTPARSGTLALRDEVLPASLPAPQPTPLAGQATLVNGAATVTLPAGTFQRCQFYDRTGNTVQASYPSATTVAIRGVGPVIDYFCP